MHPCAASFLLPKKELKNSPQLKEYEEKQKNRSEEDEMILADRFMLLFKEAGIIKDKDPASKEAHVSFSTIAGG